MSILLKYMTTVSDSRGKQNFTVTDLPVHERPRERLLLHGASSLTSTELIAVILGKGISGESVLITAQKLLQRFGSLEGVMQASVEDIRTVKGLGLAKSAQLLASAEIGRRISNSFMAVKADRSVTTADDVAVYVRPLIGQFAKEHCVLLSLDSRKHVIAVDTVSIGTLNASLVHPREIFETAIRRHAAAIVLAHNHPSGDPTPSKADLDITDTLWHAGAIMGIELMDHVIVTKNLSVSLRSLGQLRRTVP